VAFKTSERGETQDPCYGSHSSILSGFSQFVKKHNWLAVTPQRDNV